MNKKMILSIFKNLKVALFEDMTNGRYFGNLVYTDRIFSVKLYKDSVCQYICLEYLISDVKDIKDSIESINERVITGRYIADNTKTSFAIFLPYH